MSEVTVRDLQDAVAKFRDDRQWKGLHTPKRLMESILIEAGELMQEMQWDADVRPEAITRSTRDRICLELADVTIYCIALANVLDLDLATCVRDKIKLNEEKYPC